MAIELERYHPELEGHKVLIIESDLLVSHIVHRLQKMEKMKTKVANMWPEENDKRLSLLEWAKMEGVDAVVIHPYDDPGMTEEIIEASNGGIKLVVISGSDQVDPDRSGNYKRIEEAGIPVVSKITTYGNALPRKISEKLSLLFRSDK